MTQFTNNQIQIAALPAWQEVDFENISSKYKIIVLLRYLILIILFVTILSTIYWQNDDPGNTNYLYILVSGMIFLFSLLGMNIWSMRYWGYALRENDILYRSGIFSKSVKIIPFRQVQYVDIKEGILSRLFDLSSIALHTAGAAEGLRIPGIEKSNAAAMQEYISQKIVRKSI